MDSKNIFTPDEFTQARHNELVNTLSDEELLAGCSPLKAVRRKCIECAGGSADSAAKCKMYSCPLWDYRFGTNPYKKERNISEDERKMLKEIFNREHLVTDKTN